MKLLRRGRSVAARAPSPARAPPPAASRRRAPRAGRRASRARSAGRAARGRGAPRGLRQSPIPSPARYAAPSPVVSRTRGRRIGTPRCPPGTGQRKSFSVAPPVDPELRGRPAGLPAHHLEDVPRLVRDRLERGARQMGAGRPPREADQRAARVHVPVGRAEPHEGGHQIDAARVRHRDGPAARSRPRSGSGRARPGATARRRRRRRSRPRGRRPTAGGRPAADGKDHATVVRSPGLRGDGRGAGVEEEEAPCPVRVLRAAAARTRPAQTARPAGPRRCRPRECRRPRPSRAIVSPKTPADGRTAGNTARGMRRRSVSSASQSSGECRSRACARRSRDRSRGTRPPVSCQRSQVSTVPNASSPCAARARSSGWASSSHAILVPEKYASSTSPVRARTSGSRPSARRRSQSGAERRHCQTIARWTGTPVRRSRESSSRAGS
jgi:hypothetical protein